MRHPIARLVWPVLLLIVVLLAGCRDRTPPLPAVGERAVLSCTEECTARGQCGTINGNQQVVLANDGGPSVKFQDRFFVDGTAVTLMEANEREVIAARNGAPLADTATRYLHTFFRVEDDALKSGWVSSWCVARP